MLSANFFFKGGLLLRPTSGLGIHLNLDICKVFQRTVDAQNARLQTSEKELFFPSKQMASRIVN